MYAALKRTSDLILSSMGLVVLAPVMVLLAAYVKLDSEGPVLYRGTRAGRGGKPFQMLKFRTMVVDADKMGGPSTSEDDPRLTRAGRFLRKYKLDELPQLINVLRGEMSLVGPRPEVLSEAEKYTPEERALLSVRPGITDWASIKFNDEGELLKGSVDPHQAYLEKIRPEKVRLGLEYVHNRSLRVDLEIIVQTVVKVFTSRVAR